jgi:hypothetical protein
VLAISGEQQREISSPQTQNEAGKAVGLPRQGSEIVLFVLDLVRF